VGAVRCLALSDRDPAPGLITDLIANNPVDVVLTLGDLTESSLAELRDVGLPKLGVHGNHDRDDFLPRLGVIDLHRRAVRCGPLTFGGLAGCPRYGPGGRFQYEPKDVTHWLRKVPPVDVFVTHCPPLGVDDDPGDPVHAGWAPLRQWIDAHPPAVLVHGHTYPRRNELVRRLDSGTRVEYVLGHRLIDLDGGPS
jgi:uncharacterized protein